MDIIYFNPSKSIQGKSLFEMINIYKNLEDNLIVFHSIDEFTKALMNLKEKNTIAVIFLDKEDYFLDLYPYKHYLYKVMPILILPNNRKDIVALGLRYKPFFMISNYNDFKKIAYTIKLISSNSDKNITNFDKNVFKPAA
ncbi:MAG TPA: hypothetical protein PKW07_02875 [Syntrophorhabdaceae bacterium]|mgnify:CR=1 FL=1|nr:hypothetical protein [Syntrophorhabdaceae bacterium]